MRDDLASREPSVFHQGLATLGEVSGFEVWRDDNSAACPDVAWRDDDRLWLLFEAKTLQEAELPLAARDVRQANSHDNWMQARQGWAPPAAELVTSVVSPRETLGDAADVVADPDVTLVLPQVIESLGDRAVLALSRLRGLPATLGDSEFAQETVRQFIEQALDSDSLVSALESATAPPAG